MGENNHGPCHMQMLQVLHKSSYERNHIFNQPDMLNP